jgi:molybdopterin-binding protein
MRPSARNPLTGTIGSIDVGTVMTEVMIGVE